jgi:hypothetical protein
MNFFTSKPKVFLYKMTYDAGIAPCVDEGALSLAICKPAIRANAEPGDVVVGFSANGNGRANRLLYFAEIESKISGDVYYREPVTRLDQVYKDAGSGRARHRGRGLPNHDPSGTYFSRDIGKSGLLADANVLLARKFVYLGGEGKIAYPRPELIRAKVTLGHRYLESDVFPPEYYAELTGYLQSLADSYGLGYRGKPTSFRDYKIWMANSGLALPPF